MMVITTNMKMVSFQRPLNPKKILEKNQKNNITGYIQEDHGGTNRAHKKETLTISFQLHLDTPYLKNVIYIGKR